MATEYCDRWTYFQVYGHYPPEDGSLDPAIAGGMGENKPKPETVVEAKVVAPSEPTKFDMQTSDVAETKAAEPEVEPEQG